MSPSGTQHERFRLTFGAVVVLLGFSLVPARAAAQEPDTKSRLWDGLRFPASGSYYDLVSRAELALSSRATDKKAREAAERSLAAAIRLSPDRPQAWYALGRLEAAGGKHGKAVEAFAKAQRLDPQYLPRTLGYARGMAALKSGRHVIAAKIIRGLVRTKDHPRLAATLLCNAAMAYLAAGHLREALGLYEQAIARDAAYAPPRWGLAVATHRSDLPERAARLTRAALLVDPEARFLRSPEALFVPTSDRHYLEALALEARGAPDRAREAWSAYLKAAPRAPWRSQAARALALLDRARSATALAPRGTPAGPTPPRRGRP